MSQQQEQSQEDQIDLSPLLTRLREIETEYAEDSNPHELIMLELLPMMEQMIRAIQQNQEDVEDALDDALDPRLWPLIRKLYSWMLEKIVLNEALPEDTRQEAYELALTCYAVENGITVEEAFAQAQAEAQQIEASNG